MTYEEYGVLIEEEGAVVPGGEGSATASGSDVDKTLMFSKPPNGGLSPANRKPGQKNVFIRSETDKITDLFKF
ncbi:peroxiredoxin [Bacillus amyloliquefaciens]|uniref:peroxiredoxin n=1 Tax=Bacillus amyloliquefaciens TaxID=1390 RepID=UPI000A66E258|nr:peroxiredoxin [Bacillus amyloliquefaciens]